MRSYLSPEDEEDVDEGDVDGEGPVALHPLQQIVEVIALHSFDKHGHVYLSEGKVRVDMVI